MLSTDSAWNDPANDEANVAYTRAFCDAAARSRLARPTSLPGLFEEGDAATRASYGTDYDRLSRIKAAYDPDNRFPPARTFGPPRRGRPWSSSDEHRTAARPRRGALPVGRRVWLTPVIGSSASGTPRLPPP